MNQMPSNIKNPQKLAVLKIMTGQHKGKQFRLLGNKVTIGKTPDCDIILSKNPACSQKHASIVYDADQKGYILQSLDATNLVLVNDKKVNVHKLQPKDMITIGSLDLVFSDNSVLPDRISKEHKKFSKQKSAQDKKKNITRILFGGILICVLGFLFLSDDAAKQASETKGLKTEQDILNEVEALRELNEQENERNANNSKKDKARVAFLEGFRDYRRGYYNRALKSFEYCTTIQKDHALCKSYENKAKTQIERLIQRKVVLAKTYKNNKQYEACASTFKSVEIMVQDTSSPIFKEARASRQLCQAKLEGNL